MCVERREDGLTVEPVGSHGPPTCCCVVMEMREDQHGGQVVVLLCVITDAGRTGGEDSPPGSYLLQLETRMRRAVGPTPAVKVSNTTMKGTSPWSRRELITGSSSPPSLKLQCCRCPSVF